MIDPEQVTLVYCIFGIIKQIILYIVVVIGAGGGFAALCTYLANSTIKRMEFIDEVYKKFDEDKIDDLHELLMEKKELKIPLNSKHAITLSKALGEFDRILNYYEQKLIKENDLKSIAAEILDFYGHAGVQKYIKDVYAKYEYDKRGFIEDIRFYSGLNDLGKICQKWREI